MHKNINREVVLSESPTKKRLMYGKYPCFGIYYTPDGQKPKTAFIAAHYNGEWSQHYLAEYMARRGFGYLGWNTRYQGAPTAIGFDLEHAVIDIGVGVRWLKEVAGVENVVIVGNSGGASLMGAYQSQAVDPNIEPETAPAEELLNLPAGDMYISLAAHPGRAKILTDWLDPSVTDENDPLSCDPELNMYNSKFGPPYDPEFIKRYRQAQVDRNERITKWAESELRRIRDGRPKGETEFKGKDAFGAASKDGVFDRFFMLARTFADLRFVDLTIDPSKREVGCYAGDPLQANYSGYGHPPMTSAREWLSTYSLSRTKVRIDLQLPRIKEPSIVISFNHDQGCFPSHAQELFDALGAEDKKFVSMDGGHYCEGPGADRDALADLIAGWVEEHGAKPV